MLHPMLSALSGTCSKCWKVLGQPSIQPRALTVSVMCFHHPQETTKGPSDKDVKAVAVQWFQQQARKEVWKQVYSELYIKSKVFCMHTMKVYGGLRGVASLFLINLNNGWKWSDSHSSHSASREKARSTHSM